MRLKGELSARKVYFREELGSFRTSSKRVISHVILFQPIYPEVTKRIMYGLLLQLPDLIMSSKNISIIEDREECPSSSRQHAPFPHLSPQIIPPFRLAYFVSLNIVLNLYSSCVRRTLSKGRQFHGGVSVR